MKTLALALFLLLSGTSFAQGGAWLCRPDVQKALTRIHNFTLIDGYEYAFRVDSKSVSFMTDHERNHVRIKVIVGETIALVHTHPKGTYQTPSSDDMAIAALMDVPVVVLGMTSNQIIAGMPDGSLFVMSDWDGKPLECK
jgi:hypothetical protein